MTQQPARPRIRAGQALGLTVFLATAAFLSALFVARLGTAFDSVQTMGAAFSTLCAIVAAFAMLIDAVDLWARGRAMAPQTVKMLRALVFIAVLSSLAGSLVGGNSLVIPLLLPSMIVYLLITRRRPAPAAGTTGRSRGGSGGGRTVSATPTKSRQRKGGKKHR